MVTLIAVGTSASSGLSATGVPEDVASLPRCTLASGWPAGVERENAAWPAVAAGIRTVRVGGGSVPEVSYTGSGGPADWGFGPGSERRRTRFQTLVVWRAREPVLYRRL